MIYWQSYSHSGIELQVTLHQDIFSKILSIDINPFILTALLSVALCFVLKSNQIIDVHDKQSHDYFQRMLICTYSALFFQRALFRAARYHG